MIAGILTAVLAVFLFAFAAAGQGGKAEPNRVSFAKGKTSILLSGTLSNNQQMEYVFAAKAGQRINLKVTSTPKGNFFDFDLAGNGFELETEYDSYSAYDFTAPKTGDYLLYVRKRPTKQTPRAKFSLALSIK